jgi:hypothetical protein
VTPCLCGSIDPAKRSRHGAIRASTRCTRSRDAEGHDLHNVSSENRSTPNRASCVCPRLPEQIADARDGSRCTTTPWLPDVVSMTRQPLASRSRSARMLRSIPPIRLRCRKLTTEQEECCSSAGRAARPTAGAWLHAANAGGCDHAATFTRRREHPDIPTGKRTAVELAMSLRLPNLMVLLWAGCTTPQERDCDPPDEARYDCLPVELRTANSCLGGPVVAGVAFDNDKSFPTGCEVVLPICSVHSTPRKCRCIPTQNAEEAPMWECPP